MAEKVAKLGVDPVPALAHEAANLEPGEPGEDAIEDQQLWPNPGREPLQQGFAVRKQDQVASLRQCPGDEASLERAVLEQPDAPLVYGHAHGRRVWRTTALEVSVRQNGSRRERARPGSALPQMVLA